jgi:pseudaminic acid cytidylyltransferase
MRLAVIPARGGSKRIPNKNIRLFAGKPMIAHAITAARASRLFDQVIVSTDDEEIAHISREWGAETPFVRPVELADDLTATVPVVAHAIQAYEEIMDLQIDHVCCIYPGVPFIEIDDIKESWTLLKRSDTDYCFPVTEFPSAIQRAMKRYENGCMAPYYPQYELSRTQDLEKTYHDAGQFYWGAKQAWLTNPRVHSSATGLVIPGWRVVDIDTEADWGRAERIHRAFFSNES